MSPVAERAPTRVEAYKQKLAEKRSAEDSKFAQQLRKPAAQLQMPSNKYERFVRYDSKNEHHYLHPERVVETEEYKLFREYLSSEADIRVDDHFQKHGFLPMGVVTRGSKPPVDLKLPTLTDEDALAKQLMVIIDGVKPTLKMTPVRQVIAATMDQLRKLQTLDGNYPRPLTEKSLHGILGDFVELAYPTTVSCREMLLYEMLPLLGVALGDAYYLPYSDDQHFPSIFSLAIGRTTDGKGQSWHCCKEAIRLVEPSFVDNNLHSDVASGEGLIRMCGGGRIKIEGGHKHKVAIFSTEMMTSFVAQKRKDSNLGGQLRKAYDGEQLENFRSDGKKSVKADNYMLGFCGTIAPDELRQCMPQMDWSNGAQNRFLWSIGFRDKKLSRSTARPDYRLWAERVKALLDLNAKVQPTPLDYSRDGAAAFDDWYHSLPEHDDTILAQSQARAPANVARVANIYAQLDERRLTGWQIQLEKIHVEAAIEIVDRSRQSVEWYLGQQNATKVNYDDIQKIKKAVIKKVREGGETELTASEVSNMFSHKTPEQRDEICIAAGLTISNRKSRGGRPAIVWTE